MPQDPNYPLLSGIDDPAQLRELSQEELAPLADELRQYVIQSVSATGGHLAAGLGTVELTVALHYVFDTPHDRLVWDVGHQTYPHKILTGRRERMGSMRKRDGLAGFPKRDESEYDTFGVGHSSTSISAALGMAVAAKRRDSEQQVIAVIGDGAMTAGMAFEALNHAGDLDANLIVILNDNDMSISPNVGALSNHLARILSGRLYQSMRESSRKVLSVMPSMWELARRTEEHVKGMMIPGTLFEELGFNYIGPIDGHDINTLVKTLRNLKKQKGPRFLHIVTRKGKGFTPAEENPSVYHGVGKFHPESGKLETKAPTGPTYTKIFSDWLVDMAASDDALVGITPAMSEGSGLVEFSKAYPERYFDVGIAEQHALTFAAGLACENFKPVVAIYSTFLQRAYDQLIHDVALQNLPVLFAIDRAGIVGPDGPTHAGTFDMSFLRCVPNMLIMAPADENECRQMLTTGFHHTGPAAVRYPRGQGPGIEVKRDLSSLPIGKAERRRQGEHVAILAFGCMVTAAQVAGDHLNATVVNMRFVKPLDENLIHELANQHELFVTVEDNAVTGGAGSAINEYLARAGLLIPCINLGLPDEFLPHGERDAILSDAGLDADGIIREVEAFMQHLPQIKHATHA